MSNLRIGGAPFGPWRANFKEIRAGRTLITGIRDNGHSLMPVINIPEPPEPSFKILIAVGDY